MADPTTAAPPPQDDPQGLSAALAKSSDAFGNLSMSADQLSALKGDLGDSQNAEDAITGAQIKNDSATFKGEAPKEDPHLLTGLMPLLAIGAFAGKATKLSASAMLGASIGMTNGYLNGKEEVYQENKKKFDEAYQQFKDRQEQQDKIYKEMREAYKGRIDADIKALEFARQVTQDQAQNSATLLRDHEVVQQHAEEVAHWREQMDETKHEDRVQDHFAAEKLALEQKKAAAATMPVNDDTMKLEANLFIKDPQNVRFTAPERKQIMQYLAAQGVTPQDIISGRAQTKVTYAEARSLATQKAQLERTETALTEPNGVGDQAEAAAAKVDSSKFKQFNRLSQLMAANVSDPDLAAYRVKMIALRDEYATVINKGGAPTEGSRQQATEAMDAFQPNAVPAIVKAIKETANANKEALDKNIADLGKTADPAPAAPAAAPAPPAAPNPTPAAAGAAPKVVHWSELPTGDAW